MRIPPRPHVRLLLITGLTVAVAAPVASAATPEAPPTLLWNGAGSVMEVRSTGYCWPSPKVAGEQQLVTCVNGPGPVKRKGICGAANAATVLPRGRRVRVRLAFRFTPSRVNGGLTGAKSFALPRIAKARVTSVLIPATFTGLVNIEGTTKRHGTTGSASYTVCVSRL